MESQQNPGEESLARGRTLYERIGGRDGLALLLRRFYADVRQHQVIGPVFNRAIQDWPAHLEKIADFWSNVTGGPIRYAGPMPLKHLALNIGPEHFEAWLDLWRRHCRAHLPAEAAEEMVRAADTIGERLREIIASVAAQRRSAAGEPGTTPPVGE